MNYTQIQSLIAFYLDKLKVSNPVLYVISQAAILLLLYLFGADKININDTVDTGIVVILGGLLTSVSPRTSQKAAEYKDSIRENLKDRTGATKVEATKVESTRVEQPILDDSFPDIDQSNN